tara:strand:+ start:65 stop:403 length:339 start_codon:yes stop_codon:yes gene_type:complete
MNNLKTLVREYLRDTLYEADVILRSSRDFNITIIADNIRGVCGITVCTIAAAARPVSNTHERTELKIKFHRLEPTMQGHIIRMSNDARKIDGISSFIVTSVGKVRSRIYRSE